MSLGRTCPTPERSHPVNAGLGSVPEPQASPSGPCSSRLQVALRNHSLRSPMIWKKSIRPSPLANDMLVPAHLITLGW
jgi:hypothetical protein